MRTILIHLNVEVPEEDARSPEEILSSIDPLHSRTAGIAVYSNRQARDLKGSSVALVEEV